MADDKKSAPVNAIEKAKAAVGGAAGAIADAAGAAAEAAKPIAKTAADTVQGAGKAVVKAGAEAAVDAAAAFGVKVKVREEGNLRQEDGSLVLPDPIVDTKELQELPEITAQFEKLNQPGAIVKAGKKAGEQIVRVVPAPIKKVLGDTADSIKAAKYYEEAMKLVGKGFVALEGQAAKASFSREYVINRVNRGKQPEKVTKIEELCLLRSYDLAAIVADERLHHLSLALAEGTGTGVLGVPGIPANIVASLFLYFRAVQSIALFYGYDTKSDPSELYIASDVLTAAFGGEGNLVEGPAAGVVGKFMALGEAAAVRGAVGKGWAHMAEQGGVQLLIVQIRALANAAAKKALVKAGEKELEVGAFKGLLAQIGKMLTQNALKKAVPVVGGIIGGLVDTGLMNKVLSFADIFYHKRFIAEKEMRIQALLEGKDFLEVAEEDGIEVDDLIVIDEDAGEPSLNPA